MVFGIDHALAVFETVCGENIEWNLKIWFASLGLTKAFDRVEHNQLFQALREQHVPQPYIALLRAIYFSQSGEQGDILSPMLFNPALECALRKWKGKCEHHGIAMAHHERLTNIRYADDLMLEGAVKKRQRITAQNVAINCWLGSTEWRGLV